MEGADIEIKLRLVPEVLLSCSVIRNVDLDFKRRFTLIVSKLWIKAIRLYSLTLIVDLYTYKYNPLFYIA